MKRVATLLAVILTSALTVAATAGPAEATPRRTTFFVVDTQFWQEPQPSDIVAARGPLAACSSVTDLVNDGRDLGPNLTLFFGAKQLSCGHHTVVISYKAWFRPDPGTHTFGFWKVEDSTLPGVSRGGGPLVGNNTNCDVLPGSDGCITDTFVGRVS